MGQRINIQYSIDMEDLPNEALRLATGALSRLRNIPSELSGPSEVLSLETMEEIDNIRRELAAVDFALRDVHGIVSSYVSFKAETLKPVEHQDIDRAQLQALLESGNFGDEVPS